MSDELLPIASSTEAPTTQAMEAVLWLVFTLLLLCSPAIVWAVWTWAI